MEIIDEEEQDSNFEKLLNLPLVEHVKYKWKKSIEEVNEEISFQLHNAEVLQDDLKIGISNYIILKQIGKGSFGKVFLVNLIK